MAMKRRDFLKTAGGLSLSVGLASPATAAAIAEDIQPNRLFGFADDRVPMNAANLCPMPVSISKTVARHADSLDIDMSGPNRRRIEAFKDVARRGIAAQLGVPADDVAIVRNTSEANNIVVQGLSLRAGDEVLLWDQNHPSNGVSWDVRANRSECVVRHLSVPLESASIDEVVSRFTTSLSPKTRLVSFTHISNITGFRLPARDICAAIRDRDPGIHIHIDGAQTWGVADIDLGRTGCDSFSGSAHKWYMGPREVGLLFVREERQESIWPGVVSVPWGNEAEPSVAGARRFEALGQRDDAAVAALAETVAFHTSLTPAGVERRATEIADRLREALTDIGVPFVSSRNPLFTSNVIILAAKQENRARLLENVLADAGVILAGVNGLRLSPHIYNTAEHVDRVTRAVDRSRDLLG